MTSLLLTLSLACSTTPDALPDEGGDEPGIANAPTIANQPASATATVIDLPEDVADSTNAFAWDLYGELANEGGNLFFSPLSIQAAFGLAYAGANGQTAEELARTLRYTQTGEQAHAQLGQLLSALQVDGAPYELRIANQLFGQQGWTYTEAFQQIATRHYDAEQMGLDLMGDPEGSRKTINAWAEEQTNDLIKDLLPPGSIDSSTASVLANAIYFKGDWASPFVEGATQQAPFTLADGSTTEVPLMFRRSTYRYAEVDGAQVLQLPYEGDALSMVVVLPEAGTPLSKLEESLSTKAWNKWTTALQEQEVAVHLPKFEVSAGGSIKDPLKSLGMQLAFSGGADFSDIYGPEVDLAISDVFHRAFVKVDEQGTEAAAATAIVMTRESVSMAPSFRADRPFLYAIRHDATGTLLFVGRLMDPS